MSPRPNAWLAPLVAALTLSSLGCGVLTQLDDPLGRHYALTDTQRRYTNAIRWGELEEASEFVDPSLRTAFLEKSSAFEGFRITDYSIGYLEYGGGDREAHVDVTYRGYYTASLLERPIRERQEWYRESGNDWRVRPSFDPPIGGLRQ